MPMLKTPARPASSIISRCSGRNSARQNRQAQQRNAERREDLEAGVSTADQGRVDLGRTLELFGSREQNCSVVADDRLELCVVTDAELLCPIQMLERGQVLLQLEFAQPF